MKKLLEIFEASKKLGLPLTIVFTIVAVTLEALTVLGNLEDKIYE